MDTRPRDDERSARRLRRELATVRAMLALHCRAAHGSRRGLCAECEELWGYVQARVGRCPFRADKPTCQRCTVHCFKPERREQIRRVMRFAGPRMLWRHPLLAILHLLDGRRRPR
ncbi:MAG TPA: nitrous oxide-stimulated promoter family protein [Myxococcota bacterium]|nr:nitrous oxide-stimulated promoter family protein [Myxococcota bacterium]HRY94538.1 nitrous oxide-stimulated promoter family protein [Myxococcota bacterium]HSA24221.1 nitrous oxide-stimulated promoter family protein [Myxococcota bacterium]